MKKTLKELQAQMQCDRCGSLELVGPDADIHRFAVVVWRAEDVQERAEEDFGIEITETKAREFLAAYERAMQEAMTGAGWQVIDVFIPDFFEEEIEERRRAPVAFFKEAANKNITVESPKLKGEKRVKRSTIHAREWVELRLVSPMHHEETVPEGQALIYVAAFTDLTKQDALAAMRQSLTNRNWSGPNSREWFYWLGEVITFCERHSNGDDPLLTKLKDVLKR